jgi:putative membrane-bound dehydrogenase-like protein
MVRMKHCRLIIAIAVTSITLHATFADEPASAPAKSANELQKPIEPADAAATFKVPAGFRIELVAAEPLVHDPMAMEIDENGVAYVLEIPAYNEYQKPLPHTPGSVARLQDTDGDGRFDRRTTFAGDLKYPTGLFCYDDGVFVGDPPNLLYLKDTDGDGVSDKREVVFTGFGAVQAGETQLNSFRWGLDNRIHICTGHDGGDIRPGNKPDAPARSVRNRRMLLEPRSRTFELTSGAGQHGMSFDDWGRVYACENSSPIQTIQYDDRYIERNPLMAAPAARVILSPGKNYTKLVRVSEAENWRRIRLQLIEEGAAITDTYEHDRPSGVFTSATGITIYRGNAWPKEFRDDAFIGEVVNNLVYHARIKTNGLDLSTERVGGESGFVASTDTWCRPVQFSHGPDGNLYLIDMYRELIEGVQWVPPEVVARMNPTEGSDRGRIYRIAPKNFKLPPPVRMGDASTLELVKHLTSRNGWHRDTAARLIYERQDTSAVEPLRKLLAESSFPQARMHTLYALDGLAMLEADDVLRGLKDADPHVRQHALRLAERLAADSPVVRQAMVELIGDADIVVRLQVGYSLGSFPTAERIPAITKLIVADHGDSRIQFAAQSSLATGAAEVAANVLAINDLIATSDARDFVKTLANQIGRSKNERDLRTLVTAIDALNDGTAEIDVFVKDLVMELLAEGAGASADALAEVSQGRVKEVLATLLSTSRATALNLEESPESRLQAITILGCGSFESQRPAFEELLAPQQPQPIQEAVMRILGRFADSGVVEVLLAKWPSLTPAMRSSAAEVLLSRPAWTESLLSAVESNEVSAGDFDPARIAMLKSHPTQAVREKAASVFAGAGVARRADVVANYQSALKLDGNADNGRAVFRKSCSACHVLEGEGTAVGADIGSVKEKGREAILLNILDPNREINPKFLTYSIATSEGRVITGMITEETPNNLTIRQADGVSVPINRTDIDEIESTGMSYMPEGLETQVDHQAMADLLAYLMAAESSKQGDKE